MNGSTQAVTAVLLAFLAAAIPLAVFITKATDVVKGLFDKNQTQPTWVWMVVPVVLAEAMSLGWQINLAATLAHAVPALAGSTVVAGIPGEVLTGFAIGAMAGFWHDKLDQWSSMANHAKAQQASIEAQPAAPVVKTRTP